MLDGADLAFVVPLWRRTANIERVYDAIRLATPAARIVFVVSEDDPDATTAVALHVGHDLMERLDSGDHEHDGWTTAVILAGEEGKGGAPGDYARKINAGYRNSTEPYVFTGADDLIPHPGWYDTAREQMTEGIGVVGTVDLCNPRTERGVHSTHSLVARWYADQGACMDQDHVIYHEGYHHEFCDDELVRTAMHRGAYAHAHESVVEHLHWNRDASLYDDVYKHGRARTAQSRRIFVRRRVLWGDRPGGGIRQKPRAVRREPR